MFPWGLAVGSVLTVNEPTAGCNWVRANLHGTGWIRAGCDLGRRWHVQWIQSAIAELCFVSVCVCVCFSAFTVVTFGRLITRMAESRTAAAV